MESAPPTEVLEEVCWEFVYVCLSSGGYSLITTISDIYRQQFLLVGIFFKFYSKRVSHNVPVYYLSLLSSYLLYFGVSVKSES